jgi:hypothetical protein
MTEPRPRSRLHFKFAALGAVGTALVLVPLTEVLQQQGRAVQAARDERAALNPMASAVALQRALVAHRDMSAQVLRGRTAWEPARQQGAAAVDQLVDALTQALRTLAWQHPLEESQALAEDWWQLARAVGGRSISPAASDLSHRLRVEQALQVMDLISASWAPGDDTESAVLRQAAVSLPRLSLQWSGGMPASDGAAADAALKRQARLLAALVADAPAGQATAARASAALQATQRLLAVRTPGTVHAEAASGGSAGDQRDPVQSSRDVQEARTAALQAVAEVHDAVWRDRLQALDTRVAQRQQTRALSLAGLCALCVAGLWLLSGRRRHWMRPVPTPGAYAQPAAQDMPPIPVPSATSTGAESGPEADRLLQRLRTSDGRAGRRDGAGQDSQPTLPPAD